MIAKKLLNNIQKRGVYTINNQNDYVGQTPVSIVNNTISLESNFVNKVNSIDNLQQDITNNTNSINTINTTLNGIPEQLTTITNNVSTNTNSINTINTNLATKLDTATYNQEKTNFAKTNEANTFVGKNTFKNTGDIVSIQRTNNQSFGIDFKKENGDRVAFVGTSSSEVDKATMWGVSGLKLQTTNSDIKMISGSGDFQWESSRNWNQNVDNTIVRSKDMKWVKIFNYTDSVSQPSNTWNRDSWKWTLNNLNSTNGTYEVLVVIVWRDGVIQAMRGDIVWKSGVSEAKSQIITIEKNDRIYHFQFVIKNDSKLYIYTKHDNNGSEGAMNSIRGYIKRGITYPTKVNEYW